MKRVTVLLLFLATFFQVYAQFYSTGESPFSTTWKQINTDKYQIVYPKESERDAQRLAGTLDLVVENTVSGIQSTIKRPIKIVLHSQSVYSNGYVVWAPRRMELIPTPSQDAYAQNWMDQLAIHEYRHVAQIEKLNQGFTRAISYITGDLAQGATVGLVPLWFLEGDAVVNETALTNTGRGREPSFNQRLKAIELQDDIRLRYDQIYLGTYRTSAPNHYEFGYQMVAMAQTHYAKDIWSNTLNKVARESFTLVPFYRGLKKEADLSKVKLYKQTFDYLSEKWKAEDLEQETTKSEKVSTFYKSDFVSYNHPYQLEDGSILAIRNSIDDVQKLVKITADKEKTAKVLGYNYGFQMAYSNSYVAWEKRKSSLRWDQRSYSVIRILDLQSNRTRTLRKKERHFSPSFNPSQTKLAVQKLTLGNESMLEVFDLRSRNVLASYKCPSEKVLSYNAWVNDSVIAVVASSFKGKSIYTVNLNTNKWDKIFGDTYFDISSLHASDNSIYFTYTKDGRKNIYLLSLSSKEVSRVTNVQIAADYASITADSKSILYSEYTSKGNKICKQRIDSSKKTRIEDVKEYHYAFADRLSAENDVNIQDTNLHHKTHESTKYSKLKNSINIHSWILPFYTDLDDISSLSASGSEIYPGLTLMSQNLLSTVTSSLSYYYKEGSHYFKPSLTLSSFYPIISFEAEIGGSPRVFSTQGVQLLSIPESFNNNKKLILDISQPLNFSTSALSSKLTLGVEFEYENIIIADTSAEASNNLELFEDDIYFYKGQLYSDMYISYYLTSKYSSRDIYPRWGINVYFSHLSPLINATYYSKNTVAKGNMYLPGLLQNHSIKLGVGIEKGWSRINLSRGYYTSELSSFDESNYFGVDYTAPLLYPDLSIGPLVYLKRVHTSLFYDQTNFTEELETDFGKTNKLQSYGFELAFETNFFRFYFPFTPTLRYAYRKTSGNFDAYFYITSIYSF